MNNCLAVQEEDDASPAAINRVCDLYDYPMERYFSKKNAKRAFVYDDVLQYRRKYRQDQWLLEPSQTRIERLPASSGYSVELSGNFSYYIRKPKTGTGYRARHVRNYYRLTSGYRIASVYEIK